MKERNALLIIVFAWFLGLLLCGGCASQHKPEANRVNYQFETKIPDVWYSNPKQEVSVKVQFRR